MNGRCYLGAWGALLGAVLAAILAGLPVCAQPVQIRHLERAEYLMGTVFQLQLEAPVPRPELQRLATGVFARLRHYDTLLSNYRQDSELTQVEREARLSPVALSPEFCQALVAADYYSRLSGGAFDITVAPLVRLWGFKDRHYHLPTQAELDSVQTAVGMAHLQRQGCQLRLDQPGTDLDFGAIGKGLAIDAAMQVLRQQALHLDPDLNHWAAALDGGGSTQYFWGAPASSPRGWPVVLRGSAQVVWLKNQAISSSGDDQQFFERAGQRFGHILDPRTGRPVPEPGAVTVIADSATAADALSTALLVLGPTQDASLAWLLHLRILRQLS